MKLLRKTLFFCAILILKAKCEMQSDLLFKRIARFRLDDKEKVKEVFLSNLIEETYMGSLMLCNDHGMELLRIESQDELHKVFRSLKLHWLDFDDELFLDGIKSSDNKWRFLTNGGEIDENIFYFLQDGDNFSVGDFIKVMKNGTNPAFGVLNLEREKRKFLCQKISNNDEAITVEDYQSGPLKVEVLTRMFEKIGSYETFSNYKFVKTIFYANRNSGLSHPKASRFCQNFGMELTHIDAREKYEAIIKLLVKSGIGIDTHFMIEDLRESFLEVHPWANTINTNGNQGRKEQCVSIYLNRLNEKGKLVYFDCNDDYKYQNFICEKLVVKNTWTDEYPSLNFQEVKVSKKTTGMKFLGNVQISKNIFIT